MLIQAGLANRVILSCQRRVHRVHSLTPIPYLVHAVMGDGMVSMGSVIVKPNAKKIRRIYPKTMGGEKVVPKTDGESGPDPNLRVSRPGPNLR